MWREARQKGRGEFFSGNKGDRIRDLTGFGYWFCGGGGFADGRGLGGNGAIGNLSGQEFFFWKQRWGWGQRFFSENKDGVEVGGFFPETKVTAFET